LPDEAVCLRTCVNNLMVASGRKFISYLRIWI